MLKVDWELEVRDKDGKFITKKRFRSKSWLRAFLGLIKGQFATDGATSGSGEGNESIPDTGNAPRTYPYNTGSTAVYVHKLSVLAASGDGTFGLVVGTDDSPNIIGEFALIAKIAHGSGSGQLAHGSHTIEACSNPATTMIWQFRIIRTFTNNSGASITVREIGIYVTVRDSGNIQRFFCIARDVITPVVVPNGGTLTVRYIPKITVS